MLKNTLPTRYYYLLFGIQNIIMAGESDKPVITIEKLDKQLAGQSSTPHMSLKTPCMKSTNMSHLMNTNC